MHLSDAQPRQVPERISPAEVVVHIGGRTHRAAYHAGDTLLETMWRAGLPAPSVCVQGVCGSCVVRCLKGEVHLHENHVLTDADLAAGLTLACQSVPVTAVCEIAIE
jgi:3-ketosteroid 9alpha-monooxygenase subunit B